MSAPSKAFRKGITLPELMQMFPDDETAERWFVETRWPDGIRCPYCDSEGGEAKANNPSLPYHCADCSSFFSVKTNSVMHDSEVGYQKWAMAVHLMVTNFKGVSSMKLLDIGVTQKTARYMERRIREGWETDIETFGGPMEADETYVGGKESNNNLRRTRPNRGRVRTGRRGGSREVLCAKCGLEWHDPKYNTCPKCMRESHKLCYRCGLKWHDSKYDMCHKCMQKSLLWCDYCRQRKRKPQENICRECRKLPDPPPYWRSLQNKVKHWRG